MDIWLIILILITYIFGGIGYILTIKKLDNSLLKTSKLITISLFIGWIIWLIILGFAATMTELEWWIKKKLRCSEF